MFCTGILQLHHSHGIQGDLDSQKSQTMALLSTDTAEVQKSREN